MSPFLAHQLAKDLLRQHGLTDWKFRFDRARRRFGSCSTARKTITLSRALTMMNPDDQVRDTLLHEIAHALTPGDGHGSRWKAKCVEIGANPVRCFTEKEVAVPPRRDAPYLIGCGVCNWWSDRRKLTRSRLLCRKCRTPVKYREKISGREILIVKRGS